MRANCARTHTKLSLLPLGVVWAQNDDKNRDFLCFGFHVFPRRMARHHLSFADFLVACFLETDPPHWILPFCDFFCCWSFFCLLLLARFWFRKKVATYCWSLSPFNKQSTIFSIVWQEQHTLGVRDLHKPFKTWHQTVYLHSKFCYISFCFPSRPFLGLLSDPTFLWWTQCTQFNRTTGVHGEHNFSTSFFVCWFVLVRLGGPISTYLTMPHKLEFQTAEQTRLSCIKFILLQNHGLCLTCNECPVFLNHLENLIYGWPRKTWAVPGFCSFGWSVLLVFEPLLVFTHLFLFLCWLQFSSVFFQLLCFVILNVCCFSVSFLCVSSSVLQLVSPPHFSFSNIVSKSFLCFSFFCLFLRFLHFFICSLFCLFVLLMRLSLCSVFGGGSLPSSSLACPRNNLHIAMGLMGATMRTV